MESKWQVYQDFFHKITLNECDYRTYCKELLSDQQTEDDVCAMVYNFAFKFVTDIFDELHFIDSYLVDVMIMALKNYILISKTILIEKNEDFCQRWAEVIMDRIIWDYTGSNHCLTDFKDEN